MIFVVYNDETARNERLTALLERAALTVLEQQESDPEAEVTIVLSTDEHLQKLNEQFMGIDAPTDVLSFPAEQIDPETGESYLGDIVISYERASAQAEAGGYSLEHELQLLVVHGTLHLLGYDHAEEAEKKQMWSAQSENLKRLDVPLSPP